VPGVQQRHKHDVAILDQNRMSLGAEVFAAAYDGIEDARCVLYAGRHEIARALCAGIGETRESSEQGVYGMSDGRVRLVASDEPADGSLELGKPVRIVQAGVTHGRRVAGRRVSAGMLVLELAGESE